MTIFNLPGSVTSFTCFGYSKNPAIISHLLITKNISNYNLIMKVSHTYSGLSGFCIICQAAAPLSSTQNDLSNGGHEDLVIMDDFIYS